MNASKLFNNIADRTMLRDAAVEALRQNKQHNKNTNTGAANTSPIIEDTFGSAPHIEYYNPMKTERSLSLGILQSI